MQSLVKFSCLRDSECYWAPAVPVPRPNNRNELIAGEFLARKDEARHKKSPAAREAFSLGSSARELLHLNTGVRPLFEVRKISAHSDWLIRRDSNAESRVRYAVKCRGRSSG